MGLRRILKTIATMKNLFKKMMLVAVAAMAFVACSQDNDEINATVKKTDVVFNLSIEDVTRAYFGEEQGSGSDTSFPSYWSGDESVTLVAYDANDVVLSTAWGSIEAEGEQATQARVAATFNDDLAGVAKVRAYVGSWSYDEPRVPEVGQEQYMEKEGTVASNAHTMSAEAAWDGVAQSIDLNFSHAVAYGRMQIKYLDDVTITKAIVKVDEAEYQVSLNSELDTKYIWFACDADEAIATLDIEVKASNGRSYVKTINMAAAANPLKFRTGEVSKFAVSGLVEKGADYTLNLNKVVARTGNTITFQGDDENDTWTVIFNEGLTEIAEGVYQGVNGTAWSSESALEYDYFNSSFNLAANPYQYGYYADNATINVSVEDGIYTITAFWTSYIGGPGKTVQISYVGDLTVETPVVPEPEGLVFTSAEWTNYWAPSDKLVKFYTEDGAVLQLNWYNCGEDNWIVPRTYGFANSGEIYPGTSYSYYDEVPDENREDSMEVADGTVVVSVVDGQYYIEFTNLVDWDGNMVIESATFKGAISGLIVPDSRTKLATPNVTYEIEGNMLTISWDAVDGAVGYHVDDYYHEFEQTTTNTSVTVELTEYKWWYFYVTAKAAADSTEYQDSETYEIEFNHRDPNVFADYMTNTVTYNSSFGFQFTNNGSAPYIYVYMNENDSPGRNSFVAKPYTFDYNGNTNPITGTFDINRYSTGSGTTYGSSIYSGEMLIEIVDNEYKVTIMAGSITFGYKGVPEGWPLPGGGSTEPEPGEPVQLAQPALTSSNVTSNGFDVSWTAVANASSYNVSLGGATYNVVGTSHSFTGLDPETSYTVSVVAVGDGVNYTNSEAATLTVTTEAEAVTPEPGDGNVLTSAKCFGSYYDMVPYYEFRSADGQNILNVTIYQNPTRIFAYEYSYTSSINTLASNPNKYFTSGSSYSGNCTINGVSGIVIGGGSTIKVTESLGDGAKHKIEFHIVTTGGQTYDFTFEGVIVDAR